MMQKGVPVLTHVPAQHKSVKIFFNVLLFG